MARKKPWSLAEDSTINALYNRNKTTRFTPLTIDQLFYEFKRLGYKRSRDALRNRAWQLRQVKSQDGFARRQKWFEGMRWGHLDIETTNFYANFGHMLSWAMYCPEAKQPKRNHRKPGGYLAVAPKDNMPGAVYYDVVTRQEVINYDLQDQRISQSLINCMYERADMLVTYYGTGFDIKFMRSRAMWWKQNFPTVGEKYHLDMYYRAKALGKLHRNSLGAHTAFLGIPGKDHVLGETWGRARTGEEAALKYVVNHNVEDVVILERAYERFRPYFRLSKKSI
jgi:hypothetical protein